MSSCFLTRMQVSQVADKVIWYPHLFKNFPLSVVIHYFKIVNKARILLPFFCSSIPGSSLARSLHRWYILLLNLLVWKPIQNFLREVFTEIFLLLYDMIHIKKYIYIENILLCFVFIMYYIDLKIFILKSLILKYIN